MEEQPNLTKRERKELRRQEKLAQRQTGARQQTMKRVWTWGGTILGLGLLIWGMVYLAQSNSSGSTTATGKLDPVTASDHLRDNADAPVVMVEYGDYQCPACGTYEKVVEQLSSDFGDQLAVVFRNYPLKTIHANAEAAARAAEAADKQGAFWAYHDLLYDRQNDWSQLPNTKSTFEGYAQELGLDVEQFKSDLDSQAVKDKIASDVASGDRVSLSGTPTFFLNGEAIKNPGSLEEFSALIKAKLPATNS